MTRMRVQYPAGPERRCPNRAVRPYRRVTSPDRGFRNETTLTELLSDVTKVARRLASEGVIVEEPDSEEIRWLLDFWEFKRYLRVDGDRIILDASMKDLLNGDFTKQRLFDTTSGDAEAVLSALREVLGG